MTRYTTIVLIAQPAAHGVHESVNTTRRTVYAAIGSVTRSEYYTANQSGFNPSIVFALSNEADYKGERVCEYNNEKYSIIRTYLTKNGGIELTCERAEEGAQ